MAENTDTERIVRIVLTEAEWRDLRVGAAERGSTLKDEIQRVMRAGLESQVPA